jgi:hypothetical protein
MHDVIASRFASFLRWAHPHTRTVKCLIYCRWIYWWYNDRFDWLFVLNFWVLKILCPNLLIVLPFIGRLLWSLSSSRIPQLLRF